MCFHILQVQIHGIYNREVWFSSEVWKINQESMIAKRGESASSCSRGFIKPLTFSCSARSPDRIQDEIIEKERDRLSASFVCSKFQLSIYDPFSFPIFAMFMLWFLCVCLFSFSMVPEILDWFNICESMRLNPLFGEAWFGIFSSQDEIWFLRFAWKESSWPFFFCCYLAQRYDFSFLVYVDAASHEFWIFKPQPIYCYFWKIMSEMLTIVALNPFWWLAEWVNFLFGSLGSNSPLCDLATTTITCNFGYLCLVVRKNSRLITHVYVTQVMEAL